MGSVSALTPSGGVSWVPHVMYDDVSVRESVKLRIPCAGRAVEFLTKPFCDNTQLSAIEEAVTRSRAALVNCRDLVVCKYRARYGAVYNQWMI
jgi:hypothetical protein